MTCLTKYNCQCRLEFGDTVPNYITTSKKDNKTVWTNSLDESVFEDVWRDQSKIIRKRIINQELTHIRAGVIVESWFDDSLDKTDVSGTLVGYIKDIDDKLVIRSSFNVINKPVGKEENVSRIIYKCKGHEGLTNAELIIELLKPKPIQPIDPKVQRKQKLQKKLQDDSITFEELKEYLRN